ADAVEFVRGRQFPVGVDGSDTRLTKNVAAHTGDSKSRTLVLQWAADGRAVARSAIIRCQNSQRVRPHFARQTRSKLWVADAPGEEQVNRSLEVVRVFQEERPFLGK